MSLRFAGAAVPAAPRRNPFKAGSMLARQFDGTLAAYAQGHRDIIREDRTVRCMGNGIACAFWRGYDGQVPHTVPQGTLAWAAYRAGQYQRRLDNARNVYVPPSKTNSMVKP